MSDITLYFSPASRSFTARWMLEEIGVPYRVQTVDIRKGDQKRADYLAINPMGKVPALVDGPVLVTESPAICLYLADRYSYGVLAPKIDAPERGSYLRWMIFATAVLEPAALRGDDDPDAYTSSERGWGNYKTVVNTLKGALEPGPWLLGDQFTAADVMLGAVLGFAIFNKRITNEPVLEAYNARLAAREAQQRAAAFTWPAS
jgi:glutathione S-transferase